MSRTRLIIIYIFISLSAFSQKSDSLLHLLNKENIPTKKIKILLDIAGEYYYENPTTFQLYAQQAQELFQEECVQNDTLKADILYTIGSGFATQNDTVSSFNYFNQAEILARQLADSLLLVKINGEKGLLYGKIGLSDKAIYYYQEALRLAEAINDTLGISVNVNNIGLCLLDLKQYNKAKTHFEKNLELSTQMNDIHGCAISFSNIGSIYLEQKKYDDALFQFKKTLHIVDSLHLTYGIMLSNLNIGKVYLEKNFLEASLKHQEIAYQIAKETGYSEQSACALAIAKIKFKQKDYITSIEKAEEALRIGTSVLDKKELADTYKCLQDNYLMLKNYQIANDYAQLYETTRDSIFDQQRIETFAEMEYRFQNEKKEAENQFLKSEQIKNETIIQQRTVIARAICFALILLAISASILWQKNQQKRSYNKLLRTEVKERTQHLEQSNKKLKAANKELERFAYITSHDLKEPLRNISSFAGLIHRNLKKQAYSDLEDYCHFIITSATQMNHLIEDVLAFSMIGKNQQKQRYITLDDMVGKLKTDLRLLIEEKRAHIISPSTAYMIHLPAQLSLVFKNLVENGIKYNESLTPTIKIGYQKTSHQQIFTIEDNGIGISKAYQEQIFEMFKRLHHRGDYKGSGIGLAICKKIVENLKGDLVVHSQEGKGSIFELSVPIEVMEVVS